MPFSYHRARKIQKTKRIFFDVLTGILYVGVLLFAGALAVKLGSMVVL